MSRRHLLSILILAAVLLSFISRAPAFAAGNRQGTDPVARAQQLLAQMTPEERVGQLFLVSFKGLTAGENSQISDLIANYHVGGVVLQAQNDNFVASPDTLESTYQLIAQLQNAGQPSAQTPAAESSASTPSPNYIPLFIGISQPGNGYPDDQILSGLTSLPDLMAIGATWDTSLAEQVGSVAGQELSSLGFNLFFGPSLDVIDSPAATLGNGLGASAFGGDPYWVGAMGSAYITGLHTGSKGHMMVIADHFPGRGSSDRPAGGEPATVRKSLDALKQLELAPFFAVTGNASTPESTADGLLVSHIRYQGLQGNIRSATRPVSFDSQALSLILSLPEFSSWRTAGGLMVSDDLGSQTVYLSYETAGQPFVVHLVALDAFQAGNDLLYMGNIVSSDYPDNYAAVVHTLEFFTQKYNEDPVFAQRVNDSVTRILATKFRLYGRFDPAVVIPPEKGVASIGQSQDVTFEVARRSATLISPDLSDLDTVLSSKPGIFDRMVFLTDTQTAQKCSTCPEASGLAVDALQNAVLRLYGPQGTGQVASSHLNSYPLDSLADILEGGAGNLDLEDSLKQSKWIILAIQSAEPGQTQTTLLKRFLSERQDLLRDNKNVIVFAFNAPYYLDSTDITKLTAYYCLYSKLAPFVEVAARLLFREITPLGASPVSISGVGYDLYQATAPDPNQIISLYIELPTTTTATIPAATQTLQPTPTPIFRVGDTVSVHTGIIIDHNRNPVPDGTEVQFFITLTGENGVVQQVNSTTVGGIAQVSFTIDRPGALEVRATSDLALTSFVLQLNVSNEGFSVTVVAPTPVPTLTVTPEITATPMPTPVVVTQKAGAFPGMGGWFLMVMIVSGMAGLAYWLGSLLVSIRWAVRWGLCTFTGGLFAFTYLAVRLPGASGFLQSRGWAGLIAVILLGSLAGLIAAYVWLRLGKKAAH